MKGRSFAIVGSVSAAVLGAMLLVACQSAPAPSPTTAPRAAAPAAPVAAPTAAPAPAAPTAAPAGKEVMVKVGSIQTFSGGNAISGEPAGKGLIDYFKWINDQGGVDYKDPKTGATNKLKVDHAWEDSAGDVTRGINIYNKLKEQGAKFIWVMGSPFLALAANASQDKLPVILMGPSSEASLKPAPRYMTYEWAPYNEWTYAVIRYIKSNWKDTSRAPRLALAYMDYPSGYIAIAGVPEYAKSQGVDLVDSEAIKEPLTDSTIQVKRIFDAKPDFIYGVHTSNAGAVMMKDAARLGYGGKAQWAILGSAYDEGSYLKVAPTESDGVMAIISSALVNETNLAGVQLSDTISRKYENAPLTRQEYMYSVSMGQVMVASIKSALEKVGADALTGEAVRNGMFSLKNLDTGGIVPPVTITEDRPFMMGDKTRMIQLKGSKTVVASDWQ